MGKQCYYKLHDLGCIYCRFFQTNKSGFLVCKNKDYSKIQYSKQISEYIKDV